MEFISRCSERTPELLGDLVMHQIHISIVVNVHREGLIAVPSFRSMSRAKALAESNGIGVEVILVLDRGDSLTTEIAEGWKESNLRVIKVDNGDSGVSRNDGVAMARGEWVAFLDADDLWGETWLSEAFASSLREDRNVVWHPEVNLFFGLNSFIFQHVDMESDEFQLPSLLIQNHWTSLCMARRNFLIEVPYPRTDFANQIGYEDWSWNMAVIERGAIHKIVFGTGHAIRQKLHNSTNSKACAANVIPKPTGLFQQYIRSRSELKTPLCSLR